MRPILLVLACLALASCSVSTSRDGENLGIKFDQIEVGTGYIYQNADSSLQWMDRYEGLENGQHVMRSYFRDRTGAFTRLFGIDVFDAKGRRVRMERPGFDHTFIFTPFDCTTGTTGTCAHRRTRFDSKTGAKKERPILRFQTSLAGNTLRVFDNDGRNALRRTQVLNDVNIPIRQRETNRQFGNNWDLIKTVKPGG